jgi:predicted glycosyltransferase involved in capsule biosynthesis
LAEYEKFRNKIVNLQSDLTQFRVDFLDREGFRYFASRLFDEVGGFAELCITGYFSETIRQDLERFINQKDRKLRLVTQEFDVKSSRDKKNLEVLRKLSNKGAEVKVNNRLHARFLVAYYESTERLAGVLIIGSFDFNNECIGRERYDAGIRTSNPDVIKAAIKLFNEIWEEPESSSLLEKYPQKD